MLKAVSGVGPLTPEFSGETLGAGEGLARLGVMIRKAVSGVGPLRPDLNEGNCIVVTGGGEGPAVNEEVAANGLGTKPMALAEALLVGVAGAWNPNT